jgi:pimeloyl-ACP methyl ester carboxylesterase
MPTVAAPHARQELTTHQAAGLVAFEYTSTPATPKPNSLLFVGGLTDGLGTVPYVTTLAKALETTDWSLFHLVLTSSYKGWGLGSLDQDIEQIGQCVDYVRRVKGASAPQSKVVVMGHSTGSQDVLHYLIAPNPVPQNSTVGNANELTHQPRPPLDGAIMQAPVSDRDSLLRGVRDVPELKATYDQLVDMARRQVPGEVLPLNLTTTLGFPSNNPINAYRFLSLASPDSPAHPADDDLFSTDLTDQRLAETFGVVAKRGMLRSRLMALYSGADEFAVPGVDKNALLARWKKATNAGGEGTWDDNSAVIPGASHNVKDVGQDELVERVLKYLNGI